MAAALHGQGNRAMSRQERLERRAQVLHRMARWYERQAQRAHGARAVALRAHARDMEAEALRLTLAGTGA